MKKLLGFLLMMFIGASVFSDGMIWRMRSVDDDCRIYEEEVNAIIESMDSTAIGELTLNDIREIALELSVPYQKMKFVKMSKKASFILPGIGQYMNKDVLGGTLFLISDIAVTAGTLIGAYCLLPDDLKYENLDYFNVSRPIIKETLENQTFMDMLSSMGVISAGVLANVVIRVFSASHAGNLAQKNIEEGKIQFEPKIILPAFDSFGGQGFNRIPFGMCVRMHY